jgi:transposase-like protein
MSAGTGRPCSICGHPERTEIDRQVIAGSPIRKIAASFGITQQSLRRHADAHISRSVAAAASREQAEVAEVRDASLLDQAREHHKRALAIMAKAYGSGDLRTALAGIREATRLLELQGRLLGQVAPTSVNILISNEFKTIQCVLLDALQDHPAARASVLRALEKIA